VPDREGRSGGLDTERRRGHAVGRGGQLRGRFHVGWQRRGRPVAQATWRLTTEEAVVARSVAWVCGSVPERVGNGPAATVLTSCEAISVCVEGRGAIELEMVQGGGGEVFHACGSGENKGAPCGVCPYCAGAEGCGPGWAGGAAEGAVAVRAGGFGGVRGRLVVVGVCGGGGRPGRSPRGCAGAGAVCVASGTGVLRDVVRDAGELPEAGLGGGEGRWSPSLMTLAA
jgi:hypothetical protein